MQKFFWEVYSNFRREEIEEALKRINRMEISTILQIITKICWKNNIQYKTIIKTKNMFIIELKGTHRKNALKYQKDKRVLLKDMSPFIDYLQKNSIDEGYYITTGCFSDSIIKMVNYENLNEHVMLEDGMKFAARQMGIAGKAKAEITVKKMDFHYILPD